MIETAGVPLDHEIVICSASVTSNESSGPCQDCFADVELISTCYPTESPCIIIFDSDKTGRRMQACAC